MLSGTSQVQAQQSGLVGQSEREIKVLQERSAWAQTQTAKATVALSENDFETAFALSKSAMDALPLAGDASQGIRSLTLETFSKAAFSLATQRVSEGRFDDAELVPPLQPASHTTQITGRLLDSCSNFMIRTSSTGP